ncbi:MAG: alpha/beta fold hydrolase [Chromatiales bacterium]|jgi:dienelactone hydrolase|nr:alpha/beta fold hydrolase [Chromatiales bacterium]
MYRRRRTRATALLLVALASPVQAREGGPPPDLEAFRAASQAYADSANSGPLQPGCAAAFVPAQAQRHGAVLALHGFGGCPQQFEGLAPRLAAAGFDVLVPRLPGHGRPPGPEGAEDLAGLPTGGDWQQRYDGFVATVDGLLARSPGERVLLGFSAGGALALRAVAREPRRHDRLILLAPMIGIRGGASVEWLAWQLGRVPGMAALDVKHFGPRAQCEAWQAAGRGGFCGYEVQHAAGLVGLARATRADWEARALPLATRVVLAGGEHYVSNPAALRFVERQRELGATIDVTTLPAVPHEMLTRFENVGQEMPWLEELEAAVTAAVAGGR